MFNSKNFQKHNLHLFKRKLKVMKKIILSLLVIATVSGVAVAQKVKSAAVPAAAKAALLKKYPDATKATWEKEKLNYEANWGGKSGEDMSVMFTPDGTFVEQVAAIPASSLPAGVAVYVKQHYKGAKIAEAGKVTDAKGTIMYEAEVKGKDLVFDEKGNFLKID
jgi:ABC-type sulfate transport system substrate-binding protein